MSWAIYHLFPLTLAAASAGLVLLVVAHRLVARFQPHPWATIVSDAAATIIVATTIAPVVNHEWAMKRDLEQRAWNVRVAHLEHLRPFLREDAVRLTNLGQRFSTTGYVVGPGDKDQLSFEAANWELPLLGRDLVSHFPAFWLTRETLRKEVRAQDTDVRTLVEHVERQLSLAPHLVSMRYEVALSLVHMCIGVGQGIRLDANPDGSYRYSDGIGGERANSAGGPPENLTGALAAFRLYKPDAEFETTCRRLVGRRSKLQPVFGTLSADALELSEVPSLLGDCRYTRVVSD